ncbi:probable E3 ubiquitin-protein ligase HECTD2 isoform X1 [Osmerus eperlanus]|uniref:probable E3 ubiquitin-protein ligase HECTD2 isoform X1 n=1 Tax=Osmerus eperlanus TaxID=29151 RepID=UPI002E0D78B3
MLLNMRENNTPLCQREKERDRLPPIFNHSTSVLERGPKLPYPSISSLMSSANQKRDAAGRCLSSPFILPSIKHGYIAGRELPPLCPEVKQKHRITIDILPPEVKARLSSEPVIPLRTKTTKEFLEDMDRATVSGDWRMVHEFYWTTFGSFLELNAAFKKEANAPFNMTEDSGINTKFVNAVYDALPLTPPDTQKAVLKGIINCLLREWKGRRTKDDLRAYFILVQNPQCTSPATYVIYAHLLRQVAALAEADLYVLMHWLKKLSSKRLKHLVERVHLFISTRLFPSKPEELPPLAKCSWWIPSATKVLSLLNAANSLSSRPLLPYADFYNPSLELTDYMEDYRSWQAQGPSTRFTFCQFPFILSAGVKKAIIQRDSEQQMISTARQSLVDKVSRRQRVDMSLLFLNIRVRRLQLVADSLDELTRNRADLKKKLRVTFVGEAGLDMGGLTKEWFLLLIRQIFHMDYGMFTFQKDSHCHWFSSWKCDNNSEFRLVGALMGLAVYNSITLDIRFPPCVYKKLLTPPVPPCNPDAPVGMATLSLDDLQQVMPDLARGLAELLNYEGNIEEDFCMSFQVCHEELGIVKSYNLKSGGDKIPVTNQNRKEFVQLYIDFLLNKSIFRQFAAFYHGFHSVCSSDALMLLRPEEVEVLVCGSPNLDMSTLQRLAQYEGYSKTDPTVRAFWEVVLAFPPEMQKKLLHFSTGSDRVPVGGVADLNFKISRMDVSTDWLPVSHTCFNQICLPPYKTKKELKQKITIAMSNSEGFGLE